MFRKSDEDYIKDAATALQEALTQLLARIDSLESVSNIERPMQRIPDILQLWRDDIDFNRRRKGLDPISDKVWTNYINNRTPMELLERLDQYDRELWEARQPS